MLPCASCTPAHKGESLFQCLQASSLTLTAFRQVKFVEASPVLLQLPSPRFWPLLTSHQQSLSFCSSPKTCARCWSKAGASVISPAPAEAEWQLRNFQNSILILNLSVLPHQLCSFNLKSQNKCQRNTHTWESIKSGRFIKPPWPPCTDERCPERKTQLSPGQSILSLCCSLNPCMSGHKLSKLLEYFLLIHTFWSTLKRHLWQMATNLSHSHGTSKV